MLVRTGHELKQVSINTTHLNKGAVSGWLGCLVLYINLYRDHFRDAVKDDKVIKVHSHIVDVTHHIYLKYLNTLNI